MARLWSRGHPSGTAATGGISCRLRQWSTMGALRHWLCTAPIVSVPIKVPVSADAMLSSELRTLATISERVGRRAAPNPIVAVIVASSLLRESCRADEVSGTAHLTRTGHSPRSSFPNWCYGLSMSLWLNVAGPVHFTPLLGFVGDESPEDGG